MRFLCLAALLALAFVYFSRGARPSMDGSIWNVKLKPSSILSFSRKDTLVFNEGQVASSAYAAHGFLPAAYAAVHNGERNEDAWNAVAASRQEGTINWEGLVSGDKIQGTLVWYKADGKVEKLSFAGFRKPT